MFTLAELVPRRIDPTRALPPGPIDGEFIDDKPRRK